jgi:aryl-alcohol dehydrogenase-like predicted oxidoreductase
MNIMVPALESVRLAEKLGLIALNRSPLAMGFLSGKFRAGHKFDKADIRGTSVPWLKPFKDGELNPDYVAKLDAVIALLSSGGRTPAQGALGWIWGMSRATLPIPGFRTVAQAQENAGALDFGPLPADTIAEINMVLGNGA